MTPDEVLAETRAFNAGLEQFLAKLRRVYEVPPEETRRARLEGRGALPAPVFLDEARMDTIPGRAGEIPVRVFAAPDAQGAYLHFHGGGWVLGGADHQDTLLAEILLDDSLFIDARWRAAGNASRLSLYDDAVHGFTAFPLEISRRSRAEQIEFLRG